MKKKIPHKKVPLMTLCLSLLGLAGSVAAQPENASPPTPAERRMTLDAFGARGGRLTYSPRHDLMVPETNLILRNPRYPNFICEVTATADVYVNEEPLNRFNYDRLLRTGGMDREPWQEQVGTWINGLEQESPAGRCITPPLGVTPTTPSCTPPLSGQTLRVYVGPLRGCPIQPPTRAPVGWESNFEVFFDLTCSDLNGSLSCDRLTVGQWIDFLSPHFDVLKPAHR